MIRTTLLLLLFCIGTALQAQDPTIIKSYFKKRDFGHYFYADRYAPISIISLGAMLLRNNYNVRLERSGRVIVAEPTLGAQKPIYYFNDHLNRWSLSMPLSFAIWFDFTEKRTSPILNSDYRVALLEFNYSRELKNSKIKNIGFCFIPLFYERAQGEGTHLLFI